MTRGLGGEDPRRLRAGLPSRRPFSTPAHRSSCVLAVARGRLCALSRYTCAFSARRKPLVERLPEFLDFPAFFDFDRGTFGIKARIYETTVVANVTNLSLSPPIRRVDLTSDEPRLQHESPLVALGIRVRGPACRTLSSSSRHADKQAAVRVDARWDGGG